MPYRYHANTSLVLAAVKTRLKWAEGSEIKRELDKQVEALLGPKTEADLVKPDKKKVKKVGVEEKVGQLLLHTNILEKAVEMETC